MKQFCATMNFNRALQPNPQHNACSEQSAILYRINDFALRNWLHVMICVPSLPIVMRKESGTNFVTTLPEDGKVSCPFRQSLKCLLQENPIDGGLGPVDEGISSAKGKKYC